MANGLVPANLCDACRVISRVPRGLALGSSSLGSRRPCVCACLDFKLEDLLPSLPVLGRSADDGCELCRWLWESFHGIGTSSASPLDPESAVKAVLSLMYSPSSLCKENLFLEASLSTESSSHSAMIQLVGCHGTWSLLPVWRDCLRLEVSFAFAHAINIQAAKNLQS